MSQDQMSVLPPVLSLCMIVKNEAAHLAHCLTSAQPYVDEIIVVDTGSQDETVAIARQYGAKVSHFAWANDFAAARNFSLAQAIGTWILVLDADEELIVQSDSFRAQLTPDSSILAYYLKRTDANLAMREARPVTPLYIPRLFRNLPELKYAFRFHEQVQYQEAALQDSQLSYLKDLELLHHGYTDDLIEQKSRDRNIPILEEIRQENGLSLLLLATLAGTYQATGQADKARECFAEAFERLLPNLMEGNPPEQFIFVPSLLHELGVRAFEHSDYETVRLLCQRGLEWCGDFPPINHLTGEFLKILGFHQGAIAYFESCLQMGREGRYYRGESFDIGFIGTYPAYALGCVHLDLQQWRLAQSAFAQALSFDPNYQPAQEALAQISSIQVKQIDQDGR